MVTLPTSALPQLYTRLMEEIKIRLEAVSRELRTANEKRDDADGFVHAESACLQVRMVTELIALAVVIAHNEEAEFRNDRLVGQWNAHRIFDALKRLNNDAFPIRFVLHGLTEDGLANAVLEEEGYLTKDGLCKIYDDCGELLHAGRLKDLVQRPKRYDLGRIQTWRRNIMQLLNNHVIFLPNKKKVMNVYMAKAPDGRVECDLDDLTEYEVVLSPPHIIRRYRTVL